MLPHYPSFPPFFRSLGLVENRWQPVLILLRKTAVLKLPFRFLAQVKPSLPPSLAFREDGATPLGKTADEKEAVTLKGRKTANSQGRAQGRITRSMANEANSEEAVTPQRAELGESWAGKGR